jgi:hypothetical protein
MPAGSLETERDTRIPGRWNGVARPNEDEMEAVLLGYGFMILSLAALIGAVGAGSAGNGIVVRDAGWMGGRRSALKCTRPVTVDAVSGPGQDEWFHGQWMERCSLIKRIRIPA